MNASNAENHRISDALLDFILTKKISNRSPRTIEFYQETLTPFVEFVGDDLSGRTVRGFLASLYDRELASATVAKHARAIRAFCRFCHRESYIDEPVRFEMPRVDETPKRILSREDIARLLAASNTRRDEALLLFLIDTGLRRSEAVSLRWGDVDLESGAVVVRQTKNRKVRTVFVGARTRRALLRYRREVGRDEAAPLWVGRSGKALTSSGLRQVLRRISERSGVRFSAHDLRRLCAILSIRAGMSPLHLQRLLGHSTLEMTMKYVNLTKDDLRSAHDQFGPVDNL